VLLWLGLEIAELWIESGGRRAVFGFWSNILIPSARDADAAITVPDSGLSLFILPKMQSAVAFLLTATRRRVILSSSGGDEANRERKGKRQ
jgi:hypothetical protein